MTCIESFDEPLSNFIVKDLNIIFKTGALRERAFAPRLKTNFRKQSIISIHSKYEVNLLAYYCR